MRSIALPPVRQSALNGQRRGQLATPTGSSVHNDTTSTLISYSAVWDGVLFNYAPLFGGVSLSNLGNAGDWCGAGPDPGFTPPVICGDHQTFILYTAHALAQPPASFTDGSAWAEGTFTVSEYLPHPNRLPRRPPARVIETGAGLREARRTLAGEFLA